MIKNTVHILLVEDDVVDRMACRRALAADVMREYVLFEAESGRDGLALAARHKPDCILLDYHLPDLNGLEFLDLLADGSGEVAIPVMVLTGGNSASLAVRLMRHGARDYLTKDSDRHYLEQLPAAIQRMLKAQELLESKRQAEVKFRTLVEQMQAIIYLCSADATRTLQYVSPQISALGYSAEEWLANPALRTERIHPDDRERVEQATAESNANGKALNIDYRLIAKNGDVFWFREEAHVVLDGVDPRPFVQGILVDITQRKLAEEALHRSQDALRSLAAHQERIKENERKRIAQEIHDELGSLLTGIKAYVSVSVERAVEAGSSADPLLLNAVRLSEEAIGAVRRVITDLRPSVLDQLGVWEALRWYGNQIQTRSNLVCECLIDPALSSLPIGAEVSTTVFRIVQEALTNVLRHAGASHVSIRARAQDGELVVEVKDDGKGMPTDLTTHGESWGILGMHERARHFGGAVTIRGQEGFGTTVQLRLPLEMTGGN